MSGLFQRIARRRSDDSGEPSAAAAPTPETGAQPPAPGASAAEQPTRFIGLPADAVPSQSPPAPGDSPAPGPSAAAPVAQPDSPDAATPAAEPAAPVAEQPTALFPLVPDQPTEAHPPVTAEAAALPLSAAVAGSRPVSAGAQPPAEGQPTAAAEQSGVPAPQPAAQGEQPGQQAGQGEQQPAPQPVEERRPGFRERGRMRRRLRYLRRLRELQVRDLGGLAFDLRRFERKRDDLVAQKVDQIRACDDELRALEIALEERRDVRDVREPGIGGTCPRCFSLYGSNDRFCSHCGAALGGLAQGPAQVAAPPPPAAPPAGAPSPPTAPQPPQ